MHLNVCYGEDGARPLVSNIPSHIASRDGKDDNNTAVTTSYVVNKPLMRMRTSFILHCMLLFDVDNTQLCEQ
jgi:hypothetical protein